MKKILASSLGLIFDEVPQELPDGAFSGGQNIRFADGYAQRFGGHAAVLTTPTDPAYWVANYPTPNGNFWIHSTLTGTFAHDGVTQTEITGTPLTATDANRFTSCVLGGVYVQNSQTDDPQYWGGDVGADLATLVGWDAAWRCQALRSFKAYLFALNVTKGGTNYGSMVKWSDAAEPGQIPATWDEADATKDAGELDLAETSDRVVDGLALGDLFIVYKERSMYGFQYTGGNEIFRVARLPGDHGMLAQNCAANFPGGHVVLTASDVVTHAGAEPQSILSGRMRKWLFSRIDSVNYGRCFVVANHARSEVWVCYPKVGSSTCTEALVWNYTANTFGVRDLPNVTAGAWGPLSASSADTWATDTEQWDEDTTLWDQTDISQADKRLLMASVDPEIYLMDQSGRFGGVAYQTMLERTGLAFGDPEQAKIIRAMVPRIDAPKGTVIYFQFGGKMDAEAGTSWTSAIPYTVGVSRKVDGFAHGRFLAFRMYGSSGMWRMKSMTFDVVGAGAY